jgi:PAS domain S-box-containing protein
MPPEDDADRTPDGPAPSPEGEHYQETGIQDRSAWTPDSPFSPRELRAAKEYAEMIVDSVREGLLILDLDFTVQAANQSFYKLFNMDPEETVGRSVLEIGTGQWNIPALRELLEDILPDDKTLDGYEVTHEFEDLGERTMLLNARQVNEHDLILLAIEDVTERLKTRRQLEEANQMLQDLNETLEERVDERTRQVRELSAALTQAEEHERKRLSDLLHDHIQQLIFGATMVAGRAKNLVQRITNPEHDPGDVQDDLAASLDELQSTLREAGRDTRTLSVELCPPVDDDEGLPEMLDWLVDHMRERYNLSVQVQLAEEFAVSNGDMITLLFRSVRELLFNVVKHTDVEQATVRGTVDDDQFVLSVRDEGPGFDPDAQEERSSHKGFHDMQQRLEAIGGALNVESAPGEGTRVTIRVPRSGSATPAG